MQILGHKPYFYGMYHFKAPPEEEKRFLNAIQASSVDRDWLYRKMSEKEKGINSPVSAIVPYQGKILGFSGKDALDLMEACSDIFVTTLSKIAQKDPTKQVLHSPARPFDEDQVTRFLESKGKTLENIDVINV